MKIIIEARDAQAAVKAVAKVIPQKATIPVLSHVLVAVADGIATLTGSNTDVTIETDMRADTVDTGSICLPFGPLSEFIGKAKAGQVTISVDKDMATVSSGRNRIKLATMPGADFPIYKAMAKAACEIDPKGFHDAIRFCKGSVEDSEVRYTIAGVHVCHGGGDTHFWGTDGKSAHHVVLPLIDALEPGTIPLDACTVIMGAIDGADSARVGLTEKGWYVEAGSARAWGKVIDGKFPEMDRVMAQFSDWAPITKDPIPAGDISDAINMASIGSDRDSQKARNIIVKAANGKITMRGHKGQAGVIDAGRAEIEAETVAVFGAILNGERLRGALANMDGNIDIASSGNKAIRIRQHGKDDTEAVIMTMPAMASELADE